MPRLRTAAPLFRDGRILGVGTEIDVPQDDAARLVGDGLCVAVDAAEPKAEPAPQPRQRTRRKTPTARG